MRADAVGGDGVQEEGVAVGLRLGDLRSGDRAAGAGAIAGDDGLPEGVGELRADDARDEVGSAAGRHRDDELQRSIWIAVLGSDSAGPAENNLANDNDCE
jgi:hypothetical protein